jgi:hypothetical protein
VKYVLRNYEKVVRRLFKSESGIIENENRESPIPGVIQVASADVISQIFHSDAKRQEEINGRRATAIPQAIERIREGGRNTNLWEHCMRAAHHCDNFNAFLDVACTQNTKFLTPLADDEVVKVAKSAWGYTERDENTLAARACLSTPPK